MALLDQHMKKWLRHMVKTVVMLVTLTSVAVGLNLAGHKLEKLDLSPWLTNGVHFMEQFAFFADVITFCFNVVIGVWHLATAQFHKPRSRHDRR